MRLVSGERESELRHPYMGLYEEIELSLDFVSRSSLLTLDDFERSPCLCLLVNLVAEDAC